MAADCLYSAFSDSLDAATNNGIDAVVSAGISSIRPVLQWSVMAAVTAGGFAVSFGKMTAERLGVWSVRALAVAWLIGGAASYNPVVRAAVMDEAPNLIASAMNVQGGQITASQQFCTLRAANESLASKVFGEATGWSVSALGARLSAEAALGWQGLLLEIMFAIWLIGRRLAALALCLGPFLISFELFENTRGFVRHWVGTMVGLLCFQLTTAIQLRLSYEGAAHYLRDLRGSMAGGLDAMVQVLWDAAGWHAMDAVTMFAIPAICAVGSGVAVQMAAGSQAVQNLIGKGVRAANRAFAAANRARGAQGAGRGTTGTSQGARP
jgi:hypothetical protein